MQLYSTVYSNIRKSEQEHVTYSSHGDDRPPESFRNRIELIVRVVLDAFGIEDKRGKDDNTDDEKEYEKGKLFGARSERVDQDLQSYVSAFNSYILRFILT